MPTLILIEHLTNGVPFEFIFGRPFVKRFALCYQTVVCLVSDVSVLWRRGQTVGWIKMKLGMQVGLGPGHSVRWGPSSPPQKGDGAANFRPMSIVAKRLYVSGYHLVLR